MLLATLLWACLWDSDTIRAEAKGIPEVVQIIAGRFERNPPLYYEMRLARAAARISAEPDDLEAYDDAGVSADRLGRGDEAIAWMERKAERLDAMKKAGIDAARVKDHGYRYLANIGTFYVHRWVRAGADRENLADAERARDLIREAIALNPDAHFGREKYQLMAIEWLIAPPPEHEGWPPLMVPLAELRRDPGGAVKGLTGLVALGNAWESVDVFAALMQALILYDGRSVLADLARLRAEQLIDEGRRSFHPLGPDDPRELRRRLPSSPSMSRRYQDEALASRFRALRAEADSWQAARTAFMIERLQVGRHPDTDPNFWDGYLDAGPPDLDEPDEEGTNAARIAPFQRLLERSPVVIAIGSSMVAALGAIILVVARRLRDGRPRKKAVVSARELAHRWEP